MLELEKIQQECFEFVANNFDINILFSVYNGGRQMGICRVNSDVDISFCYARTMEHSYNYGKILLSSKSVDIHGWDIMYSINSYKTFVESYNQKKAYSEAQLHEHFLLFIYTKAPLIFQAENFISKIETLIAPLFYNKTALEFYVNKANLNFSTRLFPDNSKKEILLRGILYTMRNILSAVWVIENNTAPPTLIDDLLKILDDKSRIDQIQDIKQKYCSSENKNISMPMDYELIDYFNKTLNYIVEYKNKLPLKNDFPWENINKIMDII